MGSGPRACAAAALGLNLFGAADSHAQSELVDRVVVAFTAAETGGPRSPRFVFERILAFEARLEALSEGGLTRTGRRHPYLEHHVRAAMERHVSETLLASLPIDPEPTAAELTRQVRTANLMLLQRVGGIAALEGAATAEGIDRKELFELLRRRARASLYLHRMVAPMLAPSEAELRRIHSQAPEPLRRRSYRVVRVALRHWYVARQLSQAVANYYQSSRSRIRLSLLDLEARE